MTQASGSFQIFTDSTASGGKAVAFVSNATLSTQVTVNTTANLVVRARGVEYREQAIMTIQIDGVTVGKHTMYPTTSWKDFTYLKALTPGTHKIAIISSNTYSSSRYNQQVRADSLTIQ